MTNRPRPFIFLCILCFAAALAAPIAHAQAGASEKPRIYTYVSVWTVPRDMWGAYQKQNAADEDIMKKQVADGTIIGFGSYSVLNHQEGQPTHGSWFSANSMANLLKALETLRTAPGATSAPFAAAKHWDYILHSNDYNAHAGTFTDGYLRISNWTFAKTAGASGSSVLKPTIVATLEKLLSDGSLHSYEIDEEEVHSADPGAFFVAVVTNGAEGLDKFDAAIDAMQKDNVLAGAALSGTLDAQGHRDTLAKVDTMTHK